ncbi:hypothetical protein C8Q77DRAFT_241141 [Trametes polyzona]|nr:hypothetical protein C8Q77DRAFT_241141 [Trametes polyzona]
MSHLIERLNDDVLREIYKILLPDQNLRALSMTCKAIRLSCLPFLFRAVSTGAYAITEEDFVPRYLWPYVQHMRFFGQWQSMDPELFNPLRGTPIILADALAQMPLLSSITISDTQHEPVPSDGLAVVLSYPGLRRFHGRLSFGEYPRVVRPEEWHFHAAPTTSYRQTIPAYRERHLRLCPRDLAVLSHVAKQRQVQLSLEELDVPAEVIPFTTLGATDWPKLRSIRTRGECPLEATPLVRAFGRMPALEELVLRMPSTSQVARTALLPPDWTGPIPWPNLKTLFVSYPDPHDPVYSLLPPAGLRRLELRCWPRRYFHFLRWERPTMYHLGWHDRILTASGMIEILSRCRVHDLEALDVEFEEDGRDVELFRLIASQFPNLTTLTVFRYRAPRHPDAHMLEIGRALSPLLHLRTLRLHLDFKSAPHPYPKFNAYNADDVKRHSALLRDTALTLARELGGTATETIYLLERRAASLTVWWPFHVVRGDEGVDVAVGK